MSGGSVALQGWLEARLAALPEDTFDSLDDWPENSEDLDPSLPGAFSTKLEPLTVSIEYRNASGEVSERQITLLQMSGAANSPVYIDARCQMRRARRKFRFDRILSVRGLPGLPADASPRDLLAALADLGLDPEPFGVPAPPTRKAAPASKGPPPAFKAVRQRFRSELRLLGFLAKSDGEMHSAEIAAIERYARGLAAEVEQDWQDADTAALAAYLQRLEFSAETERLCLDQLQLWHEDLSARFSQAVGEVIEADGRFDPAEIEMVFGWGLKPENVGTADPAAIPPQTPPPGPPGPARAPVMIISASLAAGILTAVYFLTR